MGVSEKTYSNQEALEKLKKTRHSLSENCAGLFVLLLGGVTISNPLPVFGSIPALGYQLKKLQKTSQIVLNMERILAEFATNNVIVTPQLDVPDNGTLDLFVRFPDPPKKAVFTIGFRSNGHSTLFFSEEKQALCVRRKRGGLKQWNINLFQRFALQEYWLRKNQVEIFGTSSRDKNRSAVKVLVLTGNTKIGKHADHLYTEVGSLRVLMVKNRVSLFVIEEDQLIQFLRSWLEK
ncbi:MAG: hypothetical protein AAF327_10980 [Cyanobacteria bacterium P01_A01_bin.37]